MPPSGRLLASIAALVIVPIGLEWVIAYIKDEQFSFPRAAVALGVVIVALLVLLFLRAGAKRITLLLETAMAVLGLATTGTGVLGLLAGRESVMNGSFIVSVCLGLLIAVVAAYAIYLERTGADFIFAAPRKSENRVVQQFDDVLVTKFPAYAEGDDEVVSLCRPELDAEDLHFVAYYVDGICRFHVDVLDSPSLNRFFRGFGREQRRSAYERAGRQLDWIMTRLNVYLRRLDGGILIRTVLDVEQGALYYYWIDRNVYLTGLTMDQPKVLIADEKLRRLANAIGLLPRGGTYPAQQVSDGPGSSRGMGSGG